MRNVDAVNMRKALLTTVIRSAIEVWISARSSSVDIIRVIWIIKALYILSSWIANSNTARIKLVEVSQQYNFQ